MYGGTSYQVGEISTDDKENTSRCFYVKLLRGVNMSSNMLFWNLMMRNVYWLNALSVQKDKFKLDVVY